MNIHPIKADIVRHSVPDESEKSIDPVNRLPDEILIKIFSFIQDGKDIRSLAQVSRRWNQVLLNHIKNTQKNMTLPLFREMIRFSLSTPTLPDLHSKLGDVFVGYNFNLQNAVGINQIQHESRRLAYNIRGLLHQLTLNQVYTFFHGISPVENKSGTLSFIQNAKETLLKLDQIFSDDEASQILNFNFNELLNFVNRNLLQPPEIRDRIYNKIKSLHKILSKIMPDLCIFVDFRYLYTVYNILVKLVMIIQIMNGIDTTWLDTYNFEEHFKEYPQEFHQWLPNGETLLGKSTVPFTIYPLCYQIVEAELSKEEIRNSLLSPSQNFISGSVVETVNRQIRPFFSLQLSLQLLRVGRIQESLEWLSEFHYNENCIMIYARRLIEHRSSKAREVLELAEKLPEDFFRVLLKHILCQLKENCKIESDWKNVVNYILSNWKIKNNLVSEIRPIDPMNAYTPVRNIKDSTYYSDFLMSIIVEIIPLDEVVGQVPLGEIPRVMKEKVRQAFNYF